MLLELGADYTERAAPRTVTRPPSPFLRNKLSRYRRRMVARIFGRSKSGSL